jgi:hypothetical protein
MSVNMFMVVTEKPRIEELDEYADIANQSKYTGYDDIEDVDNGNNIAYNYEWCDLNDTTPVMSITDAIAFEDVAAPWFLIAPDGTFIDNSEGDFDWRTWLQQWPNASVLFFKCRGA